MSKKHKQPASSCFVEVFLLRKPSDFILQHYKGAVQPVIYLGIALYVIFWILDSVIDTLLSREQGFLTQLFTPGLHEIYIRALVLFLLAAHGLYAHKSIKYRQKIEEALNQNSKSFRLLADNAGDIFYRIKVSPSLDFDYLSPSFVTTGYNIHEFYGNPQLIFDIIHPEDVPLFSAALKSPSQLQNLITLRFKRKDGSLIWIETVNTPVYDKEGNYVAVEGVARDITERKKAAEELAYRLGIEKAVSQVAGLLSHEKEAELCELLSIIGQAVGASRAYLFFFKEEMTKMDKTFEWCSEGTESKIKNLQDLETARFAWWMERILKNEDIIIPDTGRMSEEAAAERELLKSHQVHSLLVVPMFFDNIPLGFIGFDDTNGVRHWSDEDVRLLRVISGILTGHIQRKRSIEQIEYLGTHDQLTCLYNRAFFEMELHRMDRLGQLPLSVILGDVNGLKIVNDAFGHSAGDGLLVKIAQILESAFADKGIAARWGGDEFAVILPQTSHQKATELCEQIKESCLEADGNPIKPSIALGVSTKTESDQDINKVVMTAEDRMYRNKLVESASTRSSIITSLQKTLAERTYETEKHALRIRDLSLLIGRALGVKDNQLDELTLLSVLHDIGKVAIPDRILLKPGPLNPEEWEVMKTHPEIGFRIAQASYELVHVAEAISSHHERWDGSGYPQGLKGDAIPLISRIVAIADAYDVITNERPYKKALRHEDALYEIKRCAGSQFDPELVGVFLELMSNLDLSEAAATSGN